ncbi:MAG: SCO family protein [Thiohalomonadaceae bacterium]
MRIAPLMALLLITAPAWSEMQHQHAGPRHDHPHHLAMAAAKPEYARGMGHYTPPDVVLQDAHGREVALKSLLDGSRPVMLNFIYTSCTAVCPVQSATFAQARRQLPAGEQPLLVSVSIDPDHDTPERLREYAARYDADDNWVFLTGGLEQVKQVQGAFDTYRGDKMNHKPVTFLRAAGAHAWVRLDGFTSAGDLVSEYRQLRR